MQHMLAQHTDTGTQAHRHTDTQIHRYTDTHIHSHSQSQSQSQSHTATQPHTLISPSPSIAGTSASDGQPCRAARRAGGTPGCPCLPAQQQQQQRVRWQGAPAPHAARYGVLTCAGLSATTCYALLVEPGGMASAARHTRGHAGPRTLQTDANDDWPYLRGDAHHASPQCNTAGGCWRALNRCNSLRGGGGGNGGGGRAGNGERHQAAQTNPASLLRRLVEHRAFAGSWDADVLAYTAWHGQHRERTT